MARERISWHPAFYDAIQMELIEYEQFLTFEPEHQLTDEPLIIDVLVIKKEPGVIIEKSVGRIFKGHNIVEYKSPLDYVSINDFHKVCAYTFLYMAQNQVMLDDITMTLVESKRPKKLVAYIKERFGDGAYSCRDGIHYIKTDFFPIQIVETKRLTGEGKAWLRSLSDSLGPNSVIEIYQEYNKSGYRDRFRAYLDVVIQANDEAWREVLTMNGTGEQRLIDMMDEYGLLEDMKRNMKAEGIAAGKAEGIAVGKAAGKAEGIAVGKAAGKAEGIAVGKAAGKAEGETQASLTIAKKLQAIGMELEKISEITSIPADELKKQLYH